jgi:hypothetical protein
VLSAIGAFLVINEEGWIVTAAHILVLSQKLDNECTAWRTIQAQREAIQSDSRLTDQEKRKQISKLNYPPKTSTEEFSICWGTLGLSCFLVQPFKHRISWRILLRPPAPPVFDDCMIDMGAIQQEHIRQSATVLALAVGLEDDIFPGH